MERKNIYLYLTIYRIKEVRIEKKMYLYINLDDIVIQWDIKGV